MLVKSKLVEIYQQYFTAKIIKVILCFQHAFIQSILIAIYNLIKIVSNFHVPYVLRSVT